ncbi:hypothetical protein AWJ20_228 [Sugiyamaella lignohabitans]|uniref:CipC-like antibiotic response protein n=1 Tax=Sugiyamaella lignohabitans TaxID=796027 RepID=A0A167CQW6_9ASCO|nr:uncharacterized protein AWJ20_228 [Sugiyamaella lignohabitans]ANB12000.1 hypothetical protein AWJ20_228 [Sugiyamaella lignohabitans]
MFGLFEDSHNQVYNGQQHESKFSHELVAGAASFAAAKIFEDKQRKEGKPVSHQFAKEALAGIAGAEVDKLFESKGLNYLDKEKVKHQAQQNVQQGYDDHYGSQAQWDPNHPPSV